MEMSSATWLSELAIKEMENPTSIHGYQIDSFDEYNTQEIAAALGENFLHSFSSESLNSYFNLSNNNTITTTSSSMDASQTNAEKPAKQPKSDGWNSCTTQQISSPGAPTFPILLSFGSSDSMSKSEQIYGNLVGMVKPNDGFMSTENKPILPKHLISQASAYKNPNSIAKASHGTKKRNQMTKTASHPQDHVIAERKRREKLSERFIALSAIVPGLKKMDKSTILGDAIKYLKQLQERVKLLEEQAEKKTLESVVLVKKYHQLSAEDNSSSFIENLPEIVAKVSNKNILIRIHCKKCKGVLVKALAEIEKLHLTVVNSSVIPFGNFVLDITIFATMDVEFSMTVKDLVRNLQSTFQ